MHDLLTVKQMSFMHFLRTVFFCCTRCGHLTDKSVGKIMPCLTVVTIAFMVSVVLQMLIFV